MGQTSSGLDSRPSHEVTTQCFYCENPDCYEEVELEATETCAAVADDLQALPENLQGVDRSPSLEELARKFDNLLDRAKSLGLQDLIKPIEEAALTLKDFAEPAQSSSPPEPGTSCNCNHWGPDYIGPRGKWICNACGDKCQCDKTWRIPYVGQISHTTDPQLVKKEQDREKIAPIPSIRAHGDDAASASLHAEMKQSTDQLLSMPSQYSSKPSLKQETGESGATCPCGCGYFQEGEFKVCPCGCGTIIEIVDDDGELGNNRSGGPCCVCGNDLNDDLSEGPRELFNISFEKNDEEITSALEMLQAKCRIKDGIIAVLAEELRNTGDVNHIVEHLGAPCLPHIAIDFDRSMLCDYLRSASLPDVSARENAVDDDIVPKPTNFRVVRSILNSLFVEWDSPQSLCKLRGYEITVNGIVTSRVGSPTRTQAVLTSVDLTKPTVLTLYAVATNGHISDSSTITFPASNCK